MQSQSNAPDTSGSSQSPKHVPFHAATQLDRIALEVARNLKDEQRLPQYRHACEQYGEQLVRKALKQANAVPPDKIKKSKAALFFYLVKKYAGEIE